MSSDKILVIDYASFEESKYLRKEWSNTLQKSTYVVNPQYTHLLNKIIIINLPINVDIKKLSKYNTIISRFPIDEGVKCEPYELPVDRKEFSPDDSSLLILNKDMLLNLDYAEMINSGNFLVGIDTEFNNHITLAGYIILKNNFNNLSIN